jgi:hypothetical protein
MVVAKAQPRWLGSARGRRLEVAERRIPDDQFRSDNDGIGGAGGGETGHLVEQTASGLFAHFFSGIIDRCQFWLDDPRDGVIVKTYYSDVFGYPETTFFQGLKEDGRKKVICDEDAVGAGVHAEYLPGGADGGGLAEVVDDQQGWVEMQAVVR